MTRYLLLLVCSVSFSLSIGGENVNTARGTVAMGTSGKYKVDIHYVYLLSAAEGDDKGRRLIFSATDIAASIESCTTISCVAGKLDEGLEVQLDSGDTIKLRGVANLGKYGDFSTIDRSKLRTTADTPAGVAGVLALDKSHLGDGMKVDIEFRTGLTRAFKE